ncbi:MAG TPA: hypothetical protein VMG58_03885, partial [Candidatus Sulfotelmatobacter sp.]|nr:hypothetical protein [Candidatus Sulfotelmatobacter sp.]
MLKAGLTGARACFLALAASLLGVAMLAAPAVAGGTSTCSSTSKCLFGVAVSPSNPAAGTSTSFSFTVKNEASYQRLGSVKISAPAGFVITGASGAASFTSSSAMFLNLSLAPSASTILTVTATVPCGSGSYQWGIAAKQSSDFSGYGNSFQLDPGSAGNLSGTFTGTCTVQPCPPSTPCSASASSAMTAGTVTTASPAPGDSIVTRMESINSSFNYSCPTYTSVADVFGFGIFDAASVPQPTPLTVTIRIDKSLVKSSGHPGASSWQICYASTTPFTALPTTSGTATIGGVTYNTGLLPNCPSP